MKDEMRDFHGRLSDFHGEIKDFHGRLSDFHGEIKDFHGRLCTLEERFINWLTKEKK